MERIGIIGLGRMGAAMAQRFAAQGREVVGWTRSGRTVQGVPTAASIDEVVARSDVMILSLYDDDAVAEVLDKLLTLDLSGRLIVETSTVVPDLLKDRIAHIEALGADAVDAPISGGPEMVAEGRCGIFIGGRAEAAARAQGVLDAISDRIFHVGPLGAGLVMKVVNNAMFQHYFNGLAEILPLARKAGLTLETALGIVSGGPAGIPMVADRLPRVLGEDDSVGFALTGVAKDNDVFRRVVQAHDLPTDKLDIFARHLDDAIAAGYGARDIAAFINYAYEDIGRD